MMDTALVEAPATEEDEEHGSVEYITSRFATGVYTAKATAKGHALSLSTDATITGEIAVPPGTTLAVDGGGFALRREPAGAGGPARHRFFSTAAPGGAALVLRNLALVGGRAPHAAFVATNANSDAWDYDDRNAGGAVLVRAGGVLHATDVAFQHNRAPLGGAVRVCRGAKATFSSCAFSDNAARFGGGVHNAGVLSCTGCEFTDCKSEFGGACYGDLAVRRYDRAAQQARYHDRAEFVRCTFAGCAPPAASFARARRDLWAAEIGPLCALLSPDALAKAAADAAAKERRAAQCRGDGGGGGGGRGGGGGGGGRW